MKATTALISLLTTNAVQGTPLTDNLVRFYRGNGEVTDSAGSGYTLTGDIAYAEVTFPQSLRTRKVFDFVDSINGLETSAFGLPAGSSDRTIMGWFKYHPAGGRDGDPFGYGQPGPANKSYYVDMTNGYDQITLDMWGADEGINPILTGVQLQTWYHLAITYSNAANTNTAYVNGGLVKSGTCNPAPQTDVSIPARFYIAQHMIKQPHATFQGQVADVAVFSRVLSATEVQTVYSNDNWFPLAGGGGDPHFFAFGDIYFSYQGHCDLLLAKTQQYRDPRNAIEIHIRTQKVRNWSKISAIAMKVGENTIEIESDEGELLLNRTLAQSVQTDFLNIDKSAVKHSVLYKFVVEKDKMIEVKVNTRTKMVFASVSGNFPEDTVGLLGSPQNPGLFARDGSNMTGKDINIYAENWQINDHDPQLFRESRYPQYPTKCLYHMKEVNAKTHTRRLKQLKMMSVEEAKAACTVHSPGPMKVFCIEDVLNSGDLNIAKDSFYR